MSALYETPASIVTGISKGDPQAEASFVRKYTKSLIYILEKRGSDPELAQDITQETFRILLEKLRKESINEPEKLGAYVHKTALNLLLADERKALRRQTYADTDSIEAFEDEGADQIHSLAKQEARQAVRSFIKELDNVRDQKILYFYYIEEREKNDICEDLNLSLRHFDRVISRARLRLRQLIDKKQGDDYFDDVL